MTESNVQKQKLRRTEMTGSLEPKSGRSSVKPEGELCGKSVQSLLSISPIYQYRF
jgi:hypothetical protein